MVVFHYKFYAEMTQERQNLHPVIWNKLAKDSLSLLTLERMYAFS